MGTEGGKGGGGCGGGEGSECILEVGDRGSSEGGGEGGGRRESMGGGGDCIGSRSCGWLLGFCEQYQRREVVEVQVRLEEVRVFVQVYFCECGKGECNRGKRVPLWQACL